MKSKKTNQKIKKLFAILLCAAFLLPSFAQAQFSAITGSLSDSSVPIYSNQIGEPASENGVIGGALNKLGLSDISNKFSSAMSAISKTQCYSQSALDALNTADNVSKWSFGGMKLLIGDTGEALMIQGKITALNNALSCVKGQLDAAKKVEVGTLIQGQLREAAIQQYSTELATIQKRLDDLSSQYRNATRDFWKTMLVKALLETSKSISINLVNSLVNKYRITDFQGYADTVGGQVYTTQFIVKNAKDNADQLVLHSILTNPLSKSVIQPAIYQRADTALGFDPDQLSLTDPDFYTKSARIGAGNANPYVLQADAIARAAEAQAAGQQAAQSEIALGNGLKAPRDCTGSLAEQEAIDQSYNALNAEFENRSDLLDSLLNTKKTAKNLTAAQIAQLDEDIAKAKADLEDVQKRAAALPNRVGKPVIQICKGIVSPASVVYSGIDTVFGQFTEKLSDYNDNNLPFFVNFISDIGTEIGTNLIFGGNAKNTILSEMGNIETAAGMGLGYAIASSKEDSQKKFADMQKGVSINYEAKTENGKTVYYLSWDVDKNVLADANYVTITGGAGLPANILNKRLSVNFAGAQDKEFKVNVMNPGDYTYTITVYGAPDKSGNGKQLVTNTVTLTIKEQSVSSGSGPTVFGAFTEKPLELIRGPSGIKIR